MQLYIYGLSIPHGSNRSSLQGRRWFPLPPSNCYCFLCPLDSECCTAPLTILQPRVHDESVIKVWMVVEDSLKPKPQPFFLSHSFYSFESSDQLGLSWGENSLQWKWHLGGYSSLQLSLATKGWVGHVCLWCTWKLFGSAHYVCRMLQVLKRKTCGLAGGHFAECVVMCVERMRKNRKVAGSDLYKS